MHNSFRLPYHLVVEEGIFDRIPEVMKDVIPTFAEDKMILVTEENLKGIFEDQLDRIFAAFKNHELYLIKAATYDNAVALAKYITMNGIKTVIGFGGGTVLDLAKFASFVSKTTLVSLPTTLSNDSLASPVAVLGTEGKARKTFRCTIPHAILVDVNIITSAPERQLLSGVGDTISKYTALVDWKKAHDQGLEKVDQQIADLHRQRRSTFYLSLGLEFLARLMGCLEIQFILFIFTPDVSFWDCVLMQAFISLFANLFFFIPMQMGTREGGLAIVTDGMHMHGAYGVLTGLITRLRELIWTSVGLLLIRVGNKK